MRNKAWDEKRNGHSHKESEIDLRVCGCGSVHLSFFGRTTFHLSRREFLDFSRGVAQLTIRLKQAHPQSHSDPEDGLDILPATGLSH